MLDIPKWYTALAEWCSCMCIIFIMKKRYNRTVTIILSVIYFILLSGMQYCIGIMPVTFWIPGMILALILMYLFLYMSCDIKPVDAGFMWAIAFIFAEFAASIEWQISAFMLSPTRNGTKPSEICLMVFFYVVMFGIYAFYERKRIAKVKELQVTGRELLSGIVISISAFLLSNISYVNQDTPFSGSMSTEIFYIRTLVDFGGAVMLFSLQGSMIGLQVERELGAIQNILQRQYANYQLSKDSVALINQKYHDLKHQIDVIRRESNAEKREEYLKEIENGIQNFEAQNKTGNAVLDIILTNKQLHCSQHQINLTSVADGNLLHFMEVMDICSIFGNALDNAIESVEKIEDIDKRLIRMAVYKQNKFVMMRFENYYESSLYMDHEMPQTTKKNKAYHGYGLKSIYQVAEKYDGTAVIDTQDHWFQLNVLLPIPEEN